jgi:precorrin-6A/cobalt-precorrin-6A reductase
MKLLILGGTSDAIKLCKQALVRYEVIYSIKGHVRQPQLNCQIHSGGFAGTQDIMAFLLQQQIDYILDATHPYAVTISNHAKLAAKYCAIPCLHYIRPAWQQQKNDRWTFFNNMTQLISLIASNENNKARLFFTIGQLTDEFIANKSSQQRYIIRSAVTSTIRKTNNIHWIKSIGPFALENEQKLFDDYQIDALISKNSGGESIAAKIQVARERNLPVYMLERPMFHSEYPVFHSISAMLSTIISSRNCCADLPCREQITLPSRLL